MMIFIIYPFAGLLFASIKIFAAAWPGLATLLATLLAGFGCNYYIALWDSLMFDIGEIGTESIPKYSNTI